MEAIYSPKEDSFLLSKAISEYLDSMNQKQLKNFKFLYLGTGSGIQAEMASEFLSKENILAVDINEEAVRYARNLGFKAVKSDLFSSTDLRDKKFDLIAFNPPYLPEDEFDSGLDTTGGENGDELIIAFLQVAKNYLSDNGVILLLLSSLTPREKIEAEIKDNYKKEIVSNKKLFFETLEVFRLTKNS